MRKGLFSGIFLGLALLMGPAAAEEPGVVRLGAAVSLTGKYSSNGAFTRKGYDLAVQKINRAGGVTVAGKPYLLQIIYYDDESTPARGAQLVERLIQQDKVQYVLGPYSSGLTEAIAPVTEKYGVPMVEANGAAISLPQGLPLPLRGAFDHRRISARRCRHRGAAFG